jgi:hypothetical protein
MLGIALPMLDWITNFALVHIMGAGHYQLDLKKRSENLEGNLWKIFKLLQER